MIPAALPSDNPPPRVLVMSCVLKRVCTFGYRSFFVVVVTFFILCIFIAFFL